MSFKSCKKKSKQCGQKGFTAALKNAAKKEGKPVGKSGEDMPPKKQGKKCKLKA